MSFITTPTYGLDKYEKEREEAQAWLNVIKNMADTQGVDLRTEILEGPMSVEGSIVDYAENNGIDLIVVGTRGKTGLKLTEKLGLPMFLLFLWNLPME